MRDEYEVATLLQSYLQDALKQIDPEILERAIKDCVEEMQRADLKPTLRDIAAFEIMRGIARLDPTVIVRVLRAAHSEAGA